MNSPYTDNNIRTKILFAIEKQTELIKLYKNNLDRIAVALERMANMMEAYPFLNKKNYVLTEEEVEFGQEIAKKAFNKKDQ